MAMSAGYRKGEINITPMIDILLVLLIIFMVIQPDLSTGLPSAVPQDGPPGASDRTVTTITVHADGTLKLDEETLQIAELPDRLKDLYRRAAEIAVFVSAERDVDFEQVAEVIDVTKGVGIKNVGLLPR
jgi:biopolymer transport protein ExbD